MDFELDDPLLDSLLDEVLAGRSPPDLTARILQAYAARQYGDQTPEPPPILPGVQKAFEPVTAAPSLQTHSKSSGRQRSAKSWSTAMTVGVAAALIGLTVTIALVGMLRTSAPQIARDEKQPRPSPVPGPRTIVNRPDKPAPDGDRAPAPESTAPVAPQVVQQTVPQPTPSVPPETKATPPQSATENAVAAAPIPRRNRNLTPSSDVQIVSFVNAELARLWKEAGVRPTPAATDAEWCQRLYERVLGRAPTAEEQKAFVAENARTRREKLVERLLTQADYVAEFTDHWSAVLTNAFLGKNGGRSGPASREELQKYLAAALRGGKPYDHVAEELLTATGAPREGNEAYNPAVNFLLEGLDPSATAPTARVARVLLGHQVQCAQCHNHPTQQWTQEQFWALDACFRGLRLERQDGGVRLATASRGELDRAVIYEASDGLAKSVGPRFIDGTEIPFAAGADPRRELARLMINSDDFAKASVNRIWAQIFDYGFTRPVDDLGPQAAASAPAVLERLATEFAAHDFDLKRLIRWAVLSEPFARSSKLTDLASKDMPEEGEAPLFSRFYARPAQAPQVFQALVQAGRIRAASASGSDVEKARIAWLAQANQTPTSAKGGKKGAPAVGPSVLVPGGDPQHRSVSGDPTGLVKKLAGSKMPGEKQVEHLFLAAVARQPTPREQQAALQLLQGARGDQAAALEDIWWALQNSSECVVDR